MNQIPVTVRQKVILFLMVVIIIATVFIIFILLPYFKQKSASRSIFVPGSCIILPEQYCSQGKLIEWTSPSGTTYLFVAFNLPAGTPLFVGADGDLRKAVEGGAPFIGRRASIIDRSVSPPININVRGADIEFDDGMIPATVRGVEKGKKFGKVGNNGTKHTGPFAEFNTLVHLDRKDSTTGKFAPPREVYKKYFKNNDI